MAVNSAAGPVGKLTVAIVVPALTGQTLLQRRAQVRAGDRKVPSRDNVGQIPPPSGRWVIVAEPVLCRPGIDAVVGELVPARMLQHVEMEGYRQAGTLADDLHQPVDGVRRERGAALAGEDVWWRCAGTFSSGRCSRLWDRAPSGSLMDRQTKKELWVLAISASAVPLIAGVAALLIR